MSGAAYDGDPRDQPSQIVPRVLGDAANRAPQRGAGQATLVEQSRAVAEVQAAVLVAQNRPRGVSDAMKEMREVCRIPALADRAFFKFSRGGSSVTGESVHLARELARIWGNIAFGIAEMARDDMRGQSEMLAFAWDMQTNARSQTTFIVPHVRDTKGGNKPLTDMRDIYENNANMGARRLREMVFAVLPVWFREEAADICRDTLQNGGGKPLVQRIADAVAALEGIGIDRPKIERKIGKPVDTMLAEDVAMLGISFKSIKRGEITKDEEFPTGDDARAPGEKPTSKLDAIETAAKTASPAPEAPAVTTATKAPPEVLRWLEDTLDLFAKCTSASEMFKLIDRIKGNRDELRQDFPELDKRIDLAVKEANARLMPKTEDGR
jgi:hypothetical protein